MEVKPISINKTTIASNEYIFYYASFCAALYGILAVVFLNINYVDGDDASTILYHLMGRNTSIQMPYSSYHSGFDFILSFISPNEELLRNFSIIISFAFGGLVLFLTGVVLFKLDVCNPKTLFRYMLLIPFVIPEFIFNSGLYNPTNVGFSFILLSTLSLLKYCRNNQIASFVISAILFAVGVPFRWSLVFFLPVYLAIFLLVNNYKLTIKQLLIFGVFSFISICLSICTIYITGYSPADMVKTYLLGKEFIENSETSILSLAACGVSYYTLPFILCLFIGAHAVIKNKVISNKFWLLLLLCISPYFVIGFHTSFKYSITLMPILLFLGYFGFEIIREHRYLPIFLNLSIAFIWFIGIHLDSTTLAYGPGFSNKSIQYKNRTNNRNVDKRVNSSKVNLAFSGGLLMPTPEGPRPLLGYFDVIFGGKWKKYIQEQKKNRLKCLDYCKNKGTELFQDRKTAYLQCDLYNLNYNSTLYQFNGEYYYRTFVNTIIKDTIVLKIIPGRVEKVKWMTDRVESTKNEIIFRSSYSHIISQLRDEVMTSEVIDNYTIIMKK
jgi:hypothetical protein